MILWEMLYLCIFVLVIFFRIMGSHMPQRLCRDTGRCEWDLMETLRRRQVHGLGTLQLVGCLTDDRILKREYTHLELEFVMFAIFIITIAGREA